MTSEDEILSAVRERYGPVINLDESPGALIDIIRRFGMDDPDGGLPPGGTPPSPPGPTSMQEGPSLGDVMKEVLRLSRQVSTLEQRIAPPMD